MGEQPHKTIILQRGRWQLYTSVYINSNELWLTPGIVFGWSGYLGKEVSIVCEWLMLGFMLSITRWNTSYTKGQLRIHKTLEDALNAPQDESNGL